MATWSTGEVPAAAKMQALDDRVTAVENLEAKTGYTGAQTTTSSGQITITHGLGAVPTTVLFTLDDTSNTLYIPRLLSKTSTTMIVQFRNGSTGAAGIGSQTVAVYWSVSP